jgi:hypothetical protein
VDENDVLDMIENTTEVPKIKGFKDITVDIYI